MQKVPLIAAVAATIICSAPAVAPVKAMDNQTLAKLAASRDALYAQQKEIQRSYDEVCRAIDELTRKRALLEDYNRETESAIREVERAMEH